MSDTFVIIEESAQNVVIVEQSIGGVVVTETASPSHVVEVAPPAGTVIVEGDGPPNVVVIAPAAVAAGVATFDGRPGTVTFELEDAELIFSASGQLLYGTGDGTGALLDPDTDGFVLTLVDGAPAWAAGGGGGGGFTAGGDLSGSDSSQEVIGLLGIAISGTPSTDDFLKYNGSDFVWATGGGGGGSTPGAAVVRKFSFDYDTSDLNTGLSVYTPNVGDIILDAWVEIDTAWDGTTPLFDIGMFTVSEFDGWFAEVGAAVDMTLQDSAPFGSGLQTQNDTASNGSDIFMRLGKALTWRAFPILVTGANDIQVCVSQTGVPDGSDPGSTQGAAHVYIVTATPTGSSGEGLFPDFVGSGSPEGVQFATVGQWYEDTSGSSEGLYVKKSGSGDTGWFSVGGSDASIPGLLFPGDSIVGLISGGNKQAFLSDITAQAGSGNGIYYNGNTSDGDQTVQIILGPSAAYVTTFDEAGLVTFPGPIAIDAVFDGGSSLVFAYGGPPNSNISANAAGDLCIDSSTPALWQASASGNSSWVKLGSGGGGSIPTSTGSGTPEGAVVGAVGDTYQDTNTGALYWKFSNGGSDTGWSIGMGAPVDYNTGPPLPGIGFFVNEYIFIMAQDGNGVAITDVLARVGTGNGIYYQSPGTDGSQSVQIQLGTGGAFTHTFDSSGNFSTAGPIILDTEVEAGGAALFSYAGDPTGNVSARNGGDVCFDVSTPAVWQSTASGNNHWVNISSGGGGGGSFPELSGSGSPLWETGGSVGQWYEDTSGTSSGLFVKQQDIPGQFAQAFADVPPSFPVTVVTGVNDTFGFQNNGLGTPEEDFTMAAGTYTNWNDLVAAAMAAVGSASSEPFSTWCNIYAQGGSAIITASSVPTVPLTVATGVNDTFIYTPAGTGIPETFTIAAGTYTLFDDVFEAMMDAVGSLSAEPFSTYFFFDGSEGDPFVIAEENIGTYYNGDTLTSGPTDVLADLGFTSPATASGGTDGVMAVVMGTSGAVYNLSSMRSGSSNDVAADLGFTSGRNNFLGGVGGADSGWMQVGGSQDQGDLTYGLTGIEGEPGTLFLLGSNNANVNISDMAAQNDGSGNGWYWAGGDYEQILGWSIVDLLGDTEIGVQFAISNGVQINYFNGPLSLPFYDVTGGGPFAMTGNEPVVLADDAVTLPNPESCYGNHYWIKDSGSGTASVLPFGSETIDNGSSISLGPLEGVMLTTDGTNWWVIAQVATTVL